MKSREDVEVAAAESRAKPWGYAQSTEARDAVEKRREEEEKTRPFGGMRAAAFARPHLSELGLVSIPAQFTVPTVTQSYSADGQPQNERIENNAARLVTELTWYVDALKAARAAGVPN
ncbi:hypothetical protein FJT64_013222 [Amphibalanus amphitrite]|uniref:Uncharacterized protein n=1 Tax=Amphibalanus amphitrite TaxID=1232801 RepID=A0A6A4VA78_AMPAM|nr:hypothetical protein FJT64_013222 [Amphibalanus amphitrite]